MKSRTTFSHLLALALLALAAVPALAPADSSTDGTRTGNPIEGIWSFSGGAIAIEGLSDGSYQGIVVNPTSFAVCTHPAGQVIWTAMKEQTDGSFWGLHSWFKGGDKCEENPLRGETAWRVLAGADGARHLIVCFSTPGDDSQPKIDAAGKCTGGTFGPAIESSPLGGLPGSSSDPDRGPITFEKIVLVPSNASCLKRKALKIKLRNPKYDPLKEVVVKVNGKKVKAVVGTEKLEKPIILKSLPNGTFKVSIVATTVLNERLKGNRKYTICGTGSGKIRLPGAKSHAKS